MKRYNSLIAAVLIGAMSMAVFGCSSDEVEDPVAIGGQTTISVADGNNGQAASSDTFKFTYSGATVIVNTDIAPVLASLGSDYTYFESNSCAYQGLDKTFTYPHFVIYTYPNGDVDMISSIEFKSDIVATEEGLRIGDSKADVIAQYGSEYEEASNVIKYTKGDCVLSFIITDDEVSGIVYDYAGLRTA